MAEIETIVNQQIRHNSEVTTTVTDMDHASELGAMMLFGEKYGDQVRVLAMGDDGFSTELCGGTHVSRTGNIGLMRITAESGIAAGVRRIEATTGATALALFSDTERRIGEIAALVKGSRENVASKIQQVLESHKQLEKELSRLKSKMASAAGSELADQAVDVNGIRVVACQLEAADMKTLDDTVSKLKDKLGSSVVLLASIDGDKINLACGVSSDLIKQVRAGDLMKYFAPLVGGKGGGKPDKAKGAGSDIAALPSALASVAVWVGEH